MPLFRIPDIDDALLNMIEGKSASDQSGPATDNTRQYYDTRRASASAAQYAAHHSTPHTGGAHGDEHHNVATQKKWSGHDDVHGAPNSRRAEMDRQQREPVTISASNNTTTFLPVASRSVQALLEMTDEKLAKALMGMPSDMMRLKITNRLSTDRLDRIAAIMNCIAEEEAAQQQRSKNQNRSKL